MKLQQKQLIAFATVSILLTAVIVSQIKDDGLVGFTLNAQKLSLVDDKWIQYNDTWCFTKHTAIVIDQFGKRSSDTIHSTPNEGNPYFVPLSLVSDKGTEADRIQVDVKVRCNTELSYSETTGTNQVPLTADGEFTVKVYSQNKDGNYILTVKKTVSRADITLSNGNEFVIGKALINVSDINSRLTSGTYDSFQKIEVSGLISLVPQSVTWDNKPIPWTLPPFVYVIPTDDVDPENSQVSWTKLLSKGTETGGGGTPIPVPTPEKDCEELGGTLQNGLCVLKENTTNNKNNDDPKDDTDYGFLNYKLFSDCLSTIDDDQSCLDNPEFTMIYIIAGVFGALAIFQSHNSSRVIRLES